MQYKRRRIRGDDEMIAVFLLGICVGGILAQIVEAYDNTRRVKRHGAKSKNFK